GRGNGRAGRGANADPIAAAMAGLSPRDAAAFSSAMRGAGAGSVAAPVRAGVAGSAWENGKGWMLSVTVVGMKSSNQSSEGGTQSETFTGKFVASIPLNYGTPGIGVPGATGSMWSHMP